LIGVAGFAHLLLFGILIPIAAIRSKKFLDRIALTPRRRYFTSIVVQVSALTLISFAVARAEGIALFPRALPPRNAIAAGVAFLVIAIAFGWTRWTKAVKERKRVVMLFMPTNAYERAFWVVSAALAGFGEELTWRGVQTALLTRLIGNFLAAVAICVVMFAIAHAIQGWDSTIAIAVFAAAFHGIVWLSGSLYVAMGVHFLYDLIAGFAYAYLARKMDYFSPEAQTFAADPARSATRTI
jgi:membrane protease YdiL (CAAX protease family)